MDISNLVGYAKPILIICNFISCILGIVLTVLGSWIALDFTALMNSFFSQDDNSEESQEIAIRNNPNLQSEEDDDDGDEQLNRALKSVFWPLIAVGVLIIFQNIVGCFGVYRELKTWLKPYLIFVYIIMSIEVGGLVLAILEWDSLLDSIKGVFETRLKLYGKDTKVKKFWNDYMNSNYCCGVNNGTDFLLIAQLDESEILPKYCCSNVLFLDDQSICYVEQAHGDAMMGCIKLFIDNKLSTFRFDVGILSLEIFLKLIGTIATSIVLRYVVKGGKEFWDWKKQSKMHKPSYMNP